MALHNDFIDSLCTHPETRRDARDIYSKAAQRTGYASGHSLGRGHAALPAICAFLASERLGNGDVTKSQARVKACVDAKLFESTLEKVASLVPSSSSQRINIHRVTYKSLLQQYGGGEDDLVPMREVEVALDRSRALDNLLIDSESAVVKCVIFHWVNTQILQSASVPDVPSVRRDFELPQKKWKSIETLLEKHCSHMVQMLSQQARTASIGRVTRSQTRTPNKPIFAPLPNNVKLYPSESSSSPTTTKVDIVARMKRKAPTEPGPQEHESPSKRSKDRGASNLQDDDGEELPTETIIVRSTKSSHKKLNIAAWDAQRPPAAQEHPMVSSTPVQMDSSINSTPMTSTGMSDISSSSGTPRSLVYSARIGARFSLQTLPAKSHRRSPDYLDEEMPRRRRRNLRASFLDCEAYVWKPSARTTQMLERARKWEALMIDKYGDPWDDL